MRDTVARPTRLSREGRLEGQGVVVTGGRSGLGAAIAAHFVAAGARVVATSRQWSSGAPPDDSIIRLTLDVRDRDACRAVIAESEHRLGAIDVLVNNAGTAESSKFLDIDVATWRRHFVVDVDGPMWLTQATLPGMLERGRGAVISIGSIASRRGFAYVASYTAAKHALLGLTRALAAEFAQSGVTFNCICPYYVDTEMTQSTVSNIVRLTGVTAEEATSRLWSPQGRLISPEDVADVCVLLASEAGRSITGQAWNVDGGYHQG